MRYNRYVITICFVNVLAAAPLPAVEPILVSSDKEGRFLGKSMELLVDESKKLTIKDIFETYRDQFKPCDAIIPAYGFNSSAYWFRFTVDNPRQSAIEWFLEISYPLLDQIELYIPVKDGFKRKVQGDYLPFRSRDLHYRNFVFKLREKQESKRTYYLRIESTSAIDIPMRAWTVSGLSEKINIEQTLLGGYLGIMVIMIGYNLFLYFSIRDRSYLYYTIFIFLYTCFQTILNGLAFEHLWPTQIWWANNSLPLSICLASAAALQFSRSFMNIKFISKTQNYVFFVLMGIDIVCGLASLFLEYRIAIQISVILTIISVVYLFFAGLFRLIARYRPAYYFMIAWLSLIFGILLYAFKALGILPDNFFTTWSVQIGSVLEVLFLSLGLGYRYNVMKELSEEAEKKLLTTTLEMYDAVARFVPTQFLVYLGKKSIIDIGIGDAVEKQMSVLFSDIRNFTSLSEKMTVHDNFHFLNSYMRRIGPLVAKHEGFIDNYIGDAILALFPTHSDAAISSAIEIRRELHEFNLYRMSEGFSPIEIGIGINTGNLMLGTVGSEERLNTTVIGDTVNLASRLESLTKIFKAPILISDSTYQSLQNLSSYCLREVDMVRVKGKEQPVTLYEVFDTDDGKTKELKIKFLELYSKALIEYKSGRFEEASDIFTLIHSENPKDHIVKTYIERCMALIRNPPGNKWQGISRVR